MAELRKPFDGGDSLHKQLRKSRYGDYERQMKTGESMCPHCFVEQVDVFHIQSCGGVDGKDK